jgi:hypothetical protein
MGRLKQDDFELKYVPGKELAIADTLSRAPVERVQELEDRKFMGLDIRTNQVYISAIRYSAFSDKLKQKLKEESEQDSAYANTRLAYSEGRMARRKERKVREYWGFKSVEMYHVSEHFQ